MKDKKITRVCYPANLYMLLQYLLLSSPEEISETFFFFSGKHFEGIRKKIKNHKYFIFHDLPRAVRFFLWLPYWGYFILTKELHWRFIKKSSLLYKSDAKEKRPCVSFDKKV